MGSLEKVPCIEVDNSNFTEIWPHLIKAINAASWIALDLELSGIGCRRNFGINNVEERYQAFMEVIKSRAILSIGISTFEHVKCVEPDEINLVGETVMHKSDEINLVGETVMHKSDEWIQEPEERSKSVEWSYSVKSFNILVKCCESYELEEDAQKFLKNHGFDFDRQKSHGVPYSKSQETIKPSEISVKRFFAEMIIRKKPLVFHNGFIDLLFLYQHFYLNLPKSIHSFIADLMLMFPSGVYDTKYITEKVLNMDSSFLEYVYYSRQRYNVNRMMKDENHIYVHFEEEKVPCIKDSTEVRNMKTRILDDYESNIEVCLDYSRHGWCGDGIECKKSHNIDLILDRSESKKLRSRSKHGRKSNRSSKKTRKIIQKMKLLSLFNESIKEGFESGDSDESQTPSSSSVQNSLGTTGDTAVINHGGSDSGLNNGSVIDESKEGSKNEKFQKGSKNEKFQKGSKNEKFQKGSTAESDNGMTIPSEEDANKHEVGRVKSGAHRSGYDAFMTGYAFGTFLYTHCPNEPTVDGTLDSKIAGLKDLVNNIFLSGKDHPLKIRSSNYSKPSLESQEKLNQLRNLFNI